MKSVFGTTIYRVKRCILRSSLLDNGPWHSKAKCCKIHAETDAHS